MGIAPLDWIDQKTWSRDLRTLGEGTVQERARIRPRGIFEVGERETSGLSGSERILYEIIAEHAYLKDRNGSDDIQNGQDLNVSFAVLRWLEEGAQTFDFERSLMQELADTEVRDVMMSELAMPYRSIYMRFCGSVLDAEDRPIDGILVERQRIKDSFLSITSMRRMSGVVMPDMTCFIPVDGGDSVEAALEKEIALSSAAAKAQKVHKHDPSFVPTPSKLYSDAEREDMRSSFCAEITRSGERLRSLLPLVVNCLLFVDGCRSHIGMGWPTGSPDKLVRRAENAARGETRARDTLLRGNWRQAHLCTMEAEAEAGGVRGEVVSEEDRKGPRTHWRRGHWRSQPHGPGSSLRRRVRVRATIVGRASSTPAGQRTYRSTKNRSAPSTTASEGAER